MDGSIILVIEHEAPLHSEELGELLVAIGLDYSDLTGGRTLVVERISQGSTILEWTDFILSTAGHHLKTVAETAKAIKSLADLLVTLKSLFGSKKAQKPERPRTRRRKKKPGERTGEALAKMAIRHKCHMRFKRVTAQGETEEFEITPLDALQFQQQAELENERLRVVPEPRAPGVSVQDTSEKLPDLASIKQLVDARGETLTPADIDRIAEALVQILSASGQSYLIEVLASGFDRQGLYHLASTLRQKGHRPSGSHEPPLTTA